MKHSISRAAALMTAVLLLCLWLAPAALAETTPEATAQATEEPTESRRYPPPNCRRRGS